MPSRLQSLISRGALVVLASLATYACDVTDDNRLTEPPPVPPGSGKTPTSGSGSSTPAGMIASGTSTAVPPGTMKAAVTTDAGSGKASARDASIDDADSGARLDAGGASSLGGRGAAGMLAAGSGGRSGAGSLGGRGGASGTGGTGGQAGAAGGSTSPACQNQFCFSVIDCWLLDEATCNYTSCVNFACQ